MEIPQTLYSALLSADEEYLIALCNKGTVNRAKKDLSAVQPEIRQTEGETVTLTVGDIRYAPSPRPWGAAPVPAPAAPCAATGSAPFCG